MHRVETREYQFTPQRASYFFLPDRRAGVPEGVVFAAIRDAELKSSLPLDILTNLSQNQPVEVVAFWVDRHERQSQTLREQDVRLQLYRADQNSLARARTERFAHELGAIELPGGGLYQKWREDAYQDFGEDLMAEAGTGILPSRWYKAIEYDLELEHWDELREGFGQAGAWCEESQLKKDIRYKDLLATYKRKARSNGAFVLV